MKYMKLYGSIARDEHTDVDRLRRRIERYRHALRRCAHRLKGEQAARVKDDGLVQARLITESRALDQ